MTISEAKKLVKSKWGILPRCGYESIAVEDTVEIHGKAHPRKIWLVNESGTFRVREYVSGCMYCPIEKQSIQERAIDNARRMW